MILLEGKPIAEEIKTRLKIEVAKLQDKPRLAIVMVGKNAISENRTGQRHLRRR